MRSRLALVLAAAVVFAPGWQGGTTPEPLRGSDLAALVLAPTVDEGAVRESVRDVKHQLGAQQAKRRPDVISATVTGLGLATTGLVIVWVLAFYRRRLLSQPTLHTYLSRAPPRL
jgi:hypothetical protein